jgi:hypothetical protein
VHVVSVSLPLFRLRPNQAFFPHRIPVRDHPFAKVLSEILDYGSRFSDDHRFLGTWGLNSDQRRMAQRVNVCQLFRRKHILASLVDFQFIFDVEFL